MDMCKHAGKPLPMPQKDAYLWHLMPLELNTKQQPGISTTTATTSETTTKTSSFGKYYAAPFNKRVIL